MQTSLAKLTKLMYNSTKNIHTMETKKLNLTQAQLDAMLKELPGSLAIYLEQSNGDGFEANWASAIVSLEDNEDYLDAAIYTDYIHPQSGYKHTALKCLEHDIYTNIDEFNPDHGADDDYFDYNPAQAEACYAGLALIPDNSPEKAKYLKKLNAKVSAFLTYCDDEMLQDHYGAMLKNNQAN